MDKYGLLDENEFLTVYIPAINRALIYRVISKVNKNFEIFNYGLLPISSGDSLYSYDGGTASAPADGCLAGRSYTDDLQFPLSGAYDSNDMWYLPEDYKDEIFHVIQKITPSWIRIDVRIPTGISQLRFQRDKVFLGIDRDFGFSRGTFETIHIPRIHYGYRYGNDTNLPVYVSVKFIYGEYKIELVKDANLAFDILSRKISSKWVTLPIYQFDPNIGNAFNIIYNGFDGYPIYPINMREAAIASYNRILAGGR